MLTVQSEAVTAPAIAPFVELGSDLLLGPSSSARERDLVLAAPSNQSPDVGINFEEVLLGEAESS